MNDLKTFFDRSLSPNHAKSTNGTANGASPIAAGKRQMLGSIANQGVRHRATHPTIPKIISNLFISLPRPAFQSLALFGFVRGVHRQHTSRETPSEHGVDSNS